MTNNRAIISLYLLSLLAPWTACSMSTLCIQCNHRACCWTLFKDMVSSTPFSSSHTLQALQWSIKKTSIGKSCLFDIFLDNNECTASSQEGLLQTNPRSRTFRRHRGCMFPRWVCESSMITLAWGWNQAGKLCWRWLSSFQMHECSSAWLFALLSGLSALDQC